jgi:hypothetical protein
MQLQSSSDPSPWLPFAQSNSQLINKDQKRYIQKEIAEKQKREEER